MLRIDFDDEDASSVRHFEAKGRFNDLAFRMSGFKIIRGGGVGFHEMIGPFWYERGWDSWQR